MESEIECELDEEVEERIDHLIEAEEELREQTDKQLDERDQGRIDLRPSSSRDIRAATVLSGEHEDEHMAFRVRVDDEIYDVRVPWPDDPTDPDEPLVRILEWDGTPIYRLADLDSIPITFIDDEPYVVAPHPGVRRRSVDLVLPGGSTHSTSIISPSSVVRAFFTGLALRLANTPFAGITRGMFGSPALDIKVGGIAAASFTVAVILTFLIHATNFAMLFFAATASVTIGVPLAAVFLSIIFSGADIQFLR